MINFLNNKYNIVILFLFFNIFCFKAHCQTDDELKKLEDFSKLYGAVRYFHPSDEASIIDWKAFAVHGVSELLKKNNDVTLQEIFTPIAPSISFEKERYNWTSEALYPVYWIHYGLGIDSNSNSFHSYRFNKTKNIFTSKSASLFVPSHFKSAKSLKLSYYAKAESNGESFGLLKIFDINSKAIYSVVETKNPVRANVWEYRELIISNIINANQILIGLFANGSDGSFKNVKLQIEKENQVWEDIELPSFKDEANWIAEPKGDYLERDENSIKLKSVIESKQLKNTVVDSLLNLSFELKLSNNEIVTIPTIVYADSIRTQPVTYPVTIQNLITKIKNIETNKFNNTISLSNAIIAWNVFRHFYVYQDQLNLNWDSLLNELLKDAYKANTKEKHLLVLEEFLKNFKDGHIRVNQNELIPRIEDIYCTPVSFAFVENKLIVRDFKNDYKGRIKKGTIINEINDVPTQIFIDSISKYISGSEQYNKVKLLRRITEGAKDTELKIKTSENNEIKLSRSLSFTENEDFFRNNLHTKAKEIRKDIFYINLSKLEEKEIDSLVPIINNYKGLIIDNRGYPKDTRHRIFSYFAVKDTAKWLASSKILNPNYVNIGETFSGYRLNQKKFEKILQTKNVLLMDENTISNAELFGQLFKYYNLATIIGKSTAGANGNINSVKLLADFQIVFTGLKVRNPDRSPFHSIGIVPDIEIEESIKDVQQNKDIYIEKAILFLDEKK